MNVTDEDGPLRCLVTGATGYLGGRLVPELLARGYAVRCLARSPGKLRDHPWAGRAEVVRGDVTDEASVRTAMQGTDVAYYLVHALGTGRGFEEMDRRAARIFAEQARAAGVGRIVYLGGLIPSGVPEHELSPHLRSRAEVGRILLASGVPTAVLRAAVIIGSGSASFEMLRYLTERLPAMVTPSWVRTRIQPIAVRDALRLLVGCARLPHDVNRAFDIGGPDILTYQEMMQRYAAVAGLPRRVILPVPLLTPAVQPVGRADHPGAGCPRPPAGGVAQARGGLRRTGHRPLRPGPAGGLPHPRPGDPAGSPARAGRGRGHPVVLGIDSPRPQRPAADRPRLGGRKPLHG